MAVEETRQNPSALWRRLQQRTTPRSLRLGQLPHAHQMAKLMKQTEERRSESQMRAIRTSGSMRGRLRRSLAFAPLTPSGSPYSTEIKSIKEIPYSAIEFFWNIRSEANNASYLKRCVPEIMLGGKTSAAFSISTQRSDLNLKLIGVREKDGEKVLGWMARCVDLFDGQVLGVRESSTDLEKLGKAGTRIGNEVE